MCRRSKYNRLLFTFYYTFPQHVPAGLHHPPKKLPAPGAVAPPSRINGRDLWMERRDWFAFLPLTWSGVPGVLYGVATHRRDDRAPARLPRAVLSQRTLDEDCAGEPDWTSVDWLLPQALLFAGALFICERIIKKKLQQRSLRRDGRRIGVRICSGARFFAKTPITDSRVPPKTTSSSVLHRWLASSS